ncbi:MAG: hypothetical protein QNI96_12845 [Woeseiaceae bacterium]|nr:hypothetical protein [Woeseiaceae bacterium]
MDTSGAGAWLLRFPCLVGKPLLDALEFFRPSFSLSKSADDYPDGAEQQWNEYYVPNDPHNVLPLAIWHCSTNGFFEFITSR